ncbi:hypothetical protein OH492_04580 [Vibrio chagasii]|nr:hypothetical protein [Vibrio chagasii]
MEIQLERASALYRLKQKEFKAAQSLKKKRATREVLTVPQASLTEAKTMMRNAELIKEYCYYLTFLWCGSRFSGRAW